MPDIQTAATDSGPAPVPIGAPIVIVERVGSSLRPIGARSVRFDGGSAHNEEVGKVEQDDTDRLAAAAAEVEAGRGPVAVTRPGHQPVVLISAEDWHRLEDLDSAESTAWWRRDAEQRASQGEQPGDGEDGDSGLDEAEVRRRFAYLLNDTGAA